MRVPPPPEIEQHIVAIWREVLKIDSVGLYDNFFDLGGNSLQLARVHMRLRESIAPDLPLTALFDLPTVSALVSYLSSSPDREAGALDESRLRAQQQRRHRRTFRGPDPGDRL
ncbi:phosphopantetheine-binding protein [Streptomyces sp. FXJ1.4098]|uniref:phosphopantetheine-binding protein n=1 Tax=Streptomyces sp. NPDC020845 TaxID=3365096 RepID=UPI0029982013|nr:phosphopantetheine-binding protein [Streptomyces sp. FXJ1.4098]